MSLNIEYNGTEYGYIELKLEGDSGSFDLDMSEVYDPFEDWFYALERIYRSDPPSIIVNPEGATYRLDFICYGEKYCLKICKHDTSEVLFYALATREEIVQQFYGKLMEFVRSDRYDPNTYEEHDECPRLSGFHLKEYRNEILEKYLTENKPIPSKPTKQDLYFLNPKNYIGSLLFNFVISDISVKDNFAGWAYADDENVFLSLDCDFIYCMTKILNCNSMFDEFGISEYSGEYAKNLLWHISMSVEENETMTDSLFHNKYRYVFDSLEEDETTEQIVEYNEAGTLYRPSRYITVRYDKAVDFRRAKQEIQTVLTIIKNAIEVAINENKMMVMGFEEQECMRRQYVH